MDRAWSKSDPLEVRRVWLPAQVNAGMDRRKSKGATIGSVFEIGDLVLGRVNCGGVQGRK
jgi:hypothetical protein